MVAAALFGLQLRRTVGCAAFAGHFFRAGSNGGEVRESGNQGIHSCATAVTVPQLIPPLVFSFAVYVQRQTS